FVPGNVIGAIPTHDHSGSIVAVQVKIAKEKIKKKAIKSNDKPVDVVASSLRGVLSPVAANLPKILPLTRAVRRARNNNPNGEKIVNPSTRAELVCKDEWKYTHNGDLFLIHDSGGDKKRFIVFTTQKSLNFLTTCEQWLGDGTFRTAPAIFTQIYVIHGLKNGKTLPLVYLLAPNKTKVTYVNFLKVLRDRIPNYRPQRLMVDFEKAFLEAFKEVYSGVQVNGCNFHFTKCVWKHVQKYGHQKKYNEDIKFSMNIRLLMALAFVPSEDVIAAFEEIVSSEYYDQNSDCFEELLEYFELTWIGKVKHNKNKRDKPLFPIKMWNCQTAVIHDYLRSNNPCEGWNSGFNKRAGQAHPVMEELVKSLKDEQVKTDVLMTQIESGLDVSNTRLKAYRNYTERLKNFVLNYDVNKKYEYLNNVAKILASKMLF
ncbi:uncharacterized protein LOC130666560, partial [Microplitis mediator]|uniref:uncharacterized protein LOC130666560 n=1 Tax=Microplitis mediator TaxID=375433 RepID=UPI002555F132